MRFDASRDGRKIVWTIPSQHTVFVFDVASWAPFAVSNTKTIDTSAFSPIFSPGGDFVALLSFDWGDVDGKKIVTDQRLSVYSLFANDWTNTFDLTPFDGRRIYITDWR